MINPQLKERIQQQIIAEFQNLLTTVSQAPDLNPTVKNLYVTYIQAVLSNNEAGKQMLNNNGCGPANIFEIVVYIAQDLINQGQNNIDQILKVIITKTISAHICLSVKKIQSVQESFIAGISFAAGADAAKAHISAGLTDYENEILPRYRMAHRNISGMQNNSFNNNNPFAGVTQMQNQNNVNNTSLFGTSQQMPQTNNNIPLYLQDDVDVSIVADTNQPKQTITTPTQQKSIPNDAPFITFKPNEKVRYAILNNPYTCDFEFNGSEITLRRLSFDINNLKLTGDKQKGQWALERNEYLSGDKAILVHTSKEVDGNTVLVEKEITSQFQIKEMSVDQFSGIKAICVTDSYITRLISHAAKNWDGTPHAYHYTVTTTKTLPVAPSIMDVVNFIINEYNNYKSLTELSTILVAAYKKLSEEEITDSNKVKNTLSIGVLSILDDIITEHVQRQFYRNMSCINVKIDNFANDYIEAVNVAATDNDVKEMLTLLEAKNKQLPKDLIISVDENEITIKEKELLVSVDVTYQELEIEFYDKNFPSIVTNESKAVKHLINSMSQVMKSTGARRATIVTLDCVRLYVSEAYWAPGQYTISTK